ncbi:MAG: ATP-dependent helicase HrpB [Desulfuromonadaceae bacterium]|nr:ATP-dependent helicase HrpB [Desulfuromonadaceae bacterium]MDD5106376.1 ATP-dependent helicase HrpB [Desulfuromonadaceae bacterium]
MTRLPIDDILTALIEYVRIHQNVILQAPPGAGKTTRVPLALMDSLPRECGRIIMLEPRRIAAVSAASWMAECLGEEVGQTVGYAIRFERCVSAATRIEVVTEGILTRRIQSDPGLSGVALVVFDEFHERTVHADLGLALCQEVQQLRPDLKIMIMSATLDLQPLSRLLNNAPVISSSGRSFPVEMKYINDSGPVRVDKKMAAAVYTALRETDGDILAFLPGTGEIRACAALLAESGSLPQHTVICQLYGDLPISDQRKILQRGAERKIVLATSIAETSLTIDGVKTVIDCGFSRRLQYDPGNGLNRLVTVRESRASAEQRAGRAGRTSPGVCYRLFTPHTLHAMSAHAPPEITITEISPLLLELAVWGVHNLLELGWLDTPPAAAQEAGRQLLATLDLCDDEGRITPLGREVVRLPLHPRLGRLLFRARECGCTTAGCRIAALLSERDIFRGATEGRKSAAGGIDLSDRLDMLKRWQLTGRTSHGFDHSALKNVERVSRQLQRLMNCADVDESGCEEEQIARLLLAAYPDRLAQRRSSGDGYLLASGRGARLSEQCRISSAEYIIAPLLHGGMAAEAIIYLAVDIPESVIREERSRHIRCATSVMWDGREERVIAKKVESIGSVQLAVETVVPPAEHAVPAVIAAIRESGLALLPMNDSFRQLQGRLMKVRAVFPERKWPDVSDETLLNTLEKWLAPYLAGVLSGKRIAQLNLAEILKQGLDYRHLSELDELAPTHQTVPSGSRIRIDYSVDVPVLAVKLQELFGLAIGPQVCAGRVPLLLHLLSPAGRPIQITSDLQGFWNGSYQQVRKELKGRYPKHPWPDDPWSASPTRRVKSRS